MKKGAVPLNTVTQLHSIEEFNAETAPPPDLLFNIVEDVCRKQFDYYKQQSKK